jgi:hypothetical protein
LNGLTYLDYNVEFDYLKLTRHFYQNSMSLGVTNYDLNI